MIKLDDKFSIRRDRYQWILTQTYEGKDRKGNPKKQSRENYFGKIDQVASYINNVLGEKCETLDELIELYTLQNHKLAELIKGE